MAKPKEHEEKLGELHGRIAELFLEMLDLGETGPQTLGVMVRFLKDNGIVVDRVETEEVKRDMATIVPFPKTGTDE